MTPTEIIAERIRGVCTVDPDDVAAAIVTRLEAKGWVIRPDYVWPPPAPGTHESDRIPRQQCADYSEFNIARRWSRQNNPDRSHP